MVILGVDPGLAHTGWGIVEMRGQAVRCRAYGCIRTSKDDELYVRLYTIQKELDRVIERYAPVHMAVEDIFFGQNVSSAVAVSQARGVVLALGGAHRLSVMEFTPSQIKQSLTGFGRADKGQITFMVRKILALDHNPEPDHSADALAAAICYAYSASSTRLS